MPYPNQNNFPVFEHYIMLDSHFLCTKQSQINNKYLSFHHKNVQHAHIEPQILT